MRDSSPTRETRLRNRLPVVWHSAYEVDIGPHVFPTRKYRAVRDRLLAEGTISADDIHAPQPALDEDVALVHTPDYLLKIERGDFSAHDELLLEIPFSSELKAAMWLCAGGSVMASGLARDAGIAVHLGGGFHHAFPDHGEGFCLINDVAIAIRVMMRRGLAQRPVVLDCDLHHGNGTAAVFAREPEVFTFSIHQQHNYPLRKPASDLDLGLADGAGDEVYLELLARHIPRLLDEHGADFALYLAGADPYRDDQLGGLRLSLQGLRRRDDLVLSAVRKRRIPTAVALAGGYARRFADTVEIHCATVRAASEALAGGADEAT
jgi:acetoin utilization deacetylase AcuC-like enzyme